MKKIILCCIMTIHIQATHLYIKNWSTFPVHVSQITVPETIGDRMIATDISIQAGQSMPLRTTINGTVYDNFNTLVIEFNADGHTKTETIFFPDEATQEASLSFNESGYKRSPFNIIKKI